MLQETLTLIPAIAGLAAAAGGVWAARAAHRSAVTAQEAARHAEKVDRRGLLRDLSTTVHRVVDESLQIGSLIQELKTEYRMLATSSKRFFFPPLGVIAPSPAESFNKQLGASPIDLKERSSSRGHFFGALRRSLQTGENRQRAGESRPSY